jgi:1-acyl-sn-glycerol-3-phosphate acyltransferase
MSSPVDPLSLPDPNRRNIVWLTLQYLMKLVFMLWLRYRARGLENLPKTGGGLVLVNHQSFLDPMLVGLPLQRPVSNLARDSLFKVPVIGWVLRNTYVMPINRDAASTASIRHALQRMNHGFLVGLFPEGTRSTDGTVGEFKPGFISMIRRAKVPVYPVGIAGAYEAMPRGGFRLWPQRVRIVFGKPLCAEEVARLSAKGHEDELVAFARAGVVACQREAQQWRDGKS